MMNVPRNAPIGDTQPPVMHVDKFVHHRLRVRGALATLIASGPRGHCSRIKAKR
jgi:hypothetical protein